MMKRFTVLIFVFIGLLVIFWCSCTRETFTSICDTQNMSYKYNVVPILKNNCYSCHSKGNTVGSVGISLDSYDSARYYIEANQLIPNIEHAVGGVPMPYMKPKLDSCSINQIIAWQAQGYPQ